MKLENLPVIDQKDKPYCVSAVVMQMMRLAYDYPELSWEWLGYMADVADGSMNDGTDPERSFKVAKYTGVPRAGTPLKVTPEIFTEARNYLLKDYKYYGNNFASLVQAIKENSYAGLRIPANLIRKDEIGYHYVLVYKVDEKQKVIYFRNTWGKSWGTVGNGVVVWDRRMSHIIAVKKEDTRPTKQKVMEIAVKELGVKDVEGKIHNKRILEYFKKVGHSWVKDDETAWCGAFAGFCLESANIESTRKLNAKSYLDYGKIITKPIYGCLVILNRTDNLAYGHIGFFIHEDEKFVWLLGGNQSNQVNIQMFHKSRLAGYRDY